ncbi:MAG: response regulator transcription factor [Thermomicrobiaceae bacterium]|nr:response regulator transcription factor [Thermomicrobiaceae bacterium]
MKPGTRVLLVEDDRAIARLLQLELEHRRAVVRCAYDGPAALEAFEEFEPDAVVLDIMLPGLDGERVLQEIRRAGDRTPVIMLTARDAPRDKVRNLDSGADDYVTKPFDIQELLARLRAVLRRVEGDDVITVGDLEINASTREVRRAGRAIELTAREFDLLELLARNARRVLPRELILDRVWRHAPQADPNVVDVYIGYLRRKIDGPGQPALIQTVRGVGFTLRES